MPVFGSLPSLTKAALMAHWQFQLYFHDILIPVR
jgi:hypothetical protein